LKRIKVHKAKILLIVVLLSGTLCVAKDEEKKLSITLDLTYRSKWITKGSEGYGSDPALYKTIDIDLWDTGFGLGVTHQEATNSGWVDKERLNYDLYYKNSLLDDTAYQTKYKIRWRYKNYPNRPRDSKNSQEWQGKFSFPKILPVKNLFPYYTVYYEYPVGSDYDNHDKTGWLHIFGLGYDLNIPELSNPLRLTADISYRDGLGGGTKDHDWSHATLSISTKFKLADNLSFVPAVYHQISMDDSTCEENSITYCHLSLKYKL